MLSEIAKLISDYGAGTVAVAAVLYIVLRSEFQFSYPRGTHPRVSKIAEKDKFAR